MRYLPALPASVAGWLLERQQGAAPADVFAMLDAIASLHGMNGRADPTNAPITSAALERVVEIKPPRSWPKEDKALWATLPAQIRERIATREQQRDVELRRLQNEHAEKLKALKPDEPKEAVTTQKEEV